MHIAKQETKPITIEFTYSELPKFLSLYKQSGYDVESVRVIITRGANSKTSESVLLSQGYTRVDDKLVKTYIRKADVTVQLQ